MVDVWNELGKALGRALKPLAEIGGAIWTGFGDAAGDLITGFMGAADDLSTAVEPTVTSLLPSVIDKATDALTPGSPPPEIKESVDKFIAQLMEMIEKESKTEAHSLPTSAELTIREGGLIAGIIGMYAATHVVSLALDATHPMKHWGFKAAMMDMMYQFNMSEVIGPMIQAPIWAGVVLPMRMRAREAFPYDIPGSGVLPHMAAKDIIIPEVYEQNMKYHALDETWSAHMLANTYRYPGFGDMRTMIHRGVATWDDAKKALEQNLVATEYVDAYEALVPSIPGFSDLRRYAIREAFPDAVTFTEHYERMKYWMMRQGYSDYFATADWDAHWIIPTVGQADEMLHRGMITEAQHRSLYILNDIRPEDIDQLRELTWKLPGRIESRWMFRWGEIDVTDLRDYLIKDGLDPVYADSVATAMAKNQFLSDINRQIANIKGDYARGYSVEATLRSDLAALGQRSEIVEYHVMDALADRTRSIRDDELRTLRAQYARGALTMAEVLAAVEKIIIDKEARDAWIAALPTAKQVIIMEETFGTEINRLVTNAKYDYVRGYIDKAAMVGRFTLLDLPVQVIEFHVMDADEDRARGHNDKQLAVIEEGYIDDLITWADVLDMAGEIIVDEAAYNIWLNGVYLNKHKAVRV